MIRYSLKCGAGHGFESWFQNADAFAALQGAGQLACPVCGATRVEKELMAPMVRPARKAAAPTDTTDRPTLSGPASELEEAIAALRKQIEENSDYVGMNFAAEARAIHAGEAPARAIHGEARPEEARQMLEEGLPVAPLPFLPTRKVN
ncbi:DUF1178 family protein [Tabrizicola aquatica]|uniref:DUF1178 family protein n=1 Tax=Tabrizicola aquatica TaxID=909926 RepID=UPI000CD22312|nr:DUF1178 family protein [Tabrizicola aquatica]